MARGGLSADGGAARAGRTRGPTGSALTVFTGFVPIELTPHAEFESACRPKTLN